MTNSDRKTADFADDGAGSDYSGSDSDSGSASPAPKRHKANRQDNFGMTAADAGEDPEAQLAAMLSAEGGGGDVGGFGGAPAPGGFTGLQGNMPASMANLDGPSMPGGIRTAAMQPGAMAAPMAPGEARVETTPMDFSKLIAVNLPTRDFPVPSHMVDCLMTPAHRGMLTEETGCEVEWEREGAKVKLRGSQEQIKKAMRLLNRVLMHCHWGRNENKVARLIRPQMVESARCRLSPMNTLRPAEKTLNNQSPIFSIGKDKTNDLVIQDAVISRQHCILELDLERGGVYAIDTSTNGTFLNGIRLPSKSVGKVLLSHGDELLFKDPASGEQEFGYIVNLTELHVRAQVVLQAPRRLLTTEEMSTTTRDFA